MQVMDMLLFRLDRDESDAEIELALSMVGDFIAEYCCLAAIPESLFPLWADMTVDCLRLRRERAGEGEMPGLSAVTMGDVSYSFTDGGSDGSAAVQSLLADYKQRLDKARRGLFR